MMVVDGDIAMVLQSLLRTVALASVILQRVRACWRIL